MPHRPYHDEHDFLALLKLLSAAHVANPRAGYLHPGDLTWWIRQNNIFRPQEGIELFYGGDGELLGFVFSNPPEEATIQAAPHAPDAALDEMLAFARAKAADRPLTVAADAGDEALTRALQRGGMARQEDGQGVTFRYVPAVQGVPQTQLPEGFSFASVTADSALKAKRVELHRTVWHPSRVTLDAYEHLRQAPSYRAALDTVIVAPDGELAAYALGWYDPHSRRGIQEPVGTHPNWRGRGLGRQVVREVTSRLAALGAEEVTIFTFRRKEPAVKLYLSAGYQELSQVYNWRG